MWARVNELLFKKYFGTGPVTPLHNLYPSKPIFTRPKDGWTGGWLSAWLRRHVRAGVGVGISAASVSYRGDDEGSGLCRSTVRSDAAGNGSHGSFHFFDRWDGEVG